MTMVEFGGAEERGEGTRREVVFCTMADAGYFPGLVGLVNSLRLQGHDDPVIVLDLGLSPAQRAVLGAECEFVTPPTEVRRHPWLMVPYACRLGTAASVIYLDADIIVTRPLDGIIAATREGRICAFRDLEPPRWFGEWEAIFGLAGPPRHQPYVNAGFLAFSSACFAGFLARWWECCGRIVDHPTVLENPALDSPTALSNQDALNALLMSEVAPAQIEFQPLGAVAQGPTQLRQTRVVNRRRVACRFEGHVTTLLHTWGPPKPWAPAAARQLHRSAYLVCLRRLLNGRHVSVACPPHEAPIWLRPGLRGALALRRLTWARRARDASARIRRIARRPDTEPTVLSR